MEPRFGHDFSRIRTHTDETAMRSAQAVNARAYTVGRDVVFGEGRYAPGTEAGRRLLAHELAHTLQQGQVADHAKDSMRLEPSGSLEQEAEAAGRAALGSAARPYAAPTRIATSLQRQEAVDVELEAVTPEEAQRLKNAGVNLPKAQNVDPRKHGDYIDRKVTAVGYGIYLGGYLLYCGLSLPVFLPESYVDFQTTNAASVNDSIYPDHDAALAAVPFGPPAPGQGAPYTYYRGAQGALIVPTLISPATAPRTLQTILTARKQLADAVQRELVVLALSLVGGMVLNGIISRLARVGESVPKPPGEDLGGGAGGKAPPSKTTPPPDVAPPAKAAPEAAPEADMPKTAAAPPIPRLTPGNGGKMLGEAVGHLKTAPPARRMPMFEDFAAQISQATKGQWTAKKLSLGDGGAVFAGEGGEALVIDSTGKMFRGNMGDRAAFPFGPGGALQPNYALLREVK